MNFNSKMVWLISLCKLKGKFHFIQIKEKDGDQGPYQLVGKMVMKILQFFLEQRKYGKW